VFEGSPDALDAQALAQIYPGLDGLSEADAEPDSGPAPLADLLS
jgi:hypothetical protein